MSLEWYTLRSKPNREDALWREASARGFQVFYPRTHVKPVNPRARTIKAYFPGYMFVRADMDAVGFSAFAWMPYSNGLVFCGSEPSPVPDALVNAIRRHLEDVRAAGGELFDGLKHGDVVKIQTGPFGGYEAMSDARLSGTDPVHVLLSLIGNRQVPLDLPAGYVQRKNRR